MTADEPSPAWSQLRWLALLLSGLVVGVAVVVALEGWTDALSDTATLARHLVTRYALPVTFVNLYLEETGLPVPLPSDFLVANLGREFAHRPEVLVAIWAGLVATAVAGSTNLYLITRRWGPAIARSRLGMFLHLTPERLDRSERWFRRWGPFAILIGRHVIGLHVPITAAAGVLRMPYLTFALSVAASTAPWAALLLWLGTAFGARLAYLLGGHPWASLLLPAGLLVVLVAYLIELVRTRRSRRNQSSGR